MRKRDDLKKEKIFNSTITLMAELGMAGVTMSKIAKASGVPQATIYVYFESKEELLRQLYEYTISHMCTLVMDGFDDSLSARECMWEYSKRFIDYVNQHTDEYLAYEQFMSSPMSRHLQLKNVEKEFAPMYGFVEKAQRQGYIKSVLHPIVVLSYFTLPIAGIIKGNLFWGNPANDIVFKVLFEAGWDAVRVHGTESD